MLQNRNVGHDAVPANNSGEILDWWKKFRDVTLPVFNELYDSVAAGKEAALSIESNSKPDYREKLEAELKELRESELWQAGKTVRSLRPENQDAVAKVEDKREALADVR